MADKPDVISVYINETEIEERVKQLGQQISKDYAGKELLLVCVLKGAAVFCADLVRAIRHVDVSIEFVELASYHDGTESAGRVKMVKSVYGNLRDKDILIVEDIVDTGITINFLRSALDLFEPGSIKICSLLDKPSRRKPGYETDIDYLGFTIPGLFVVGYGLDKAQKHRGLPFIGRIEYTAISQLLSPIDNFINHGQQQAARSLNKVAEQFRQAADRLKDVYRK